MEIKNQLNKEGLELLKLYQNFSSYPKEVQNLISEKFKRHSIDISAKGLTENIVESMLLSIPDFVDHHKTIKLLISYVEKNKFNLPISLIRNSKGEYWMEYRIGFKKETLRKAFNVSEEDINIVFESQEFENIAVKLLLKGRIECYLKGLGFNKKNNKFPDELWEKNNIEIKVSFNRSERYINIVLQSILLPQKDDIILEQLIDEIIEIYASCPHLY